MCPAVPVNDLFLTYTHQPIHRWDIVALIGPEFADPRFTDFLKRVVGLPGEKIEIKSDTLYINDKPEILPDKVGPYISTDKFGQRITTPDPHIAATGSWGKPITLAPDEYYLLGDNSPVSEDARYWPPVANHQPGAIPPDQILYRAVFIIWPPKDFGPPK